MMWEIPPEDLMLSKDQAHVWRANLDVDEKSESAFLSVLAADEKIRAGKFRFARDRRNFIAARGVLRILLGKYLATPPSEIYFEYSKFGKPSLPAGNSLQFNITHSQNLALFAFSKHLTMGIDVEFVN
ncbi:MAG: hypothetical protein EOO01_29250, partial [Chitinophagaceae bacterium]